MSTWLPPLVIHHPRLPWVLDCSRMHIEPAALDQLPWARVLSEMEALESGAVANPDEDRQVGHYWLRSPERAPTMGQAREIGETTERLRHFAAKIRSGGTTADDGSRFTDVIAVGIGGSALGPQLLIDALAPKGATPQGGLQLHFIDNTDPDGVERTVRHLGPRLRSTLVLVVSKSGGTAETRNGYKLVRQALEGAGIHAPSQLVAVTGVGSKLYKEADSEQWAAIFPMWDWVGGRTSVTSAVGLLPAELAGIDTTPLINGAREMDEWTRTGDWRTNPAALLAGVWHRTGGGTGERAMVVLPYNDRLLLMSRYLQQLVMESLGKRLDLAGNVVHQGISVYGNKGSTDQHAYVQQLRDGRNDFFASFIQVFEDGIGQQTDLEDGATAGDFLQGFLMGTRRALDAADRPSLTMSIPRVDATSVGGLIALFERAVGLYASLVQINAYHQPGVEAGKLAAAEVLELARAVRGAIASKPTTVAKIAKELGADPLEIFYVLEHLGGTGRAIRDGSGPDAVWRARRGSD